LYRLLGLEAVHLAEGQGLDGRSAAAVRHLLKELQPGGAP
jgi:hypothetical protein